MLRSMTGFGKGEASDGRASYTVQLKSVNNRFLELGLKLPTELWSHEADARAILTAALSRGKVEIHWREQANGVEAPSARLDLEQAKAWKNALLAGAEQLGVPADLRLETLTRLPGVLGAAEAAADPAEAEAVAAARWAGLQSALTQAVAALQASREREGASLKAELEGLLGDGEARVDGIEARSTGLQAAFGERVAKRLAQIIDSLPADDPRVLQEAALLVDKADIREELVRFRTHSGEFRRLLLAPEPAGKKLDFMCQELLREANTMGSKSPEAGLTQAVVGLKAVIERIKEQVQNVE